MYIVHCESLVSTSPGKVEPRYSIHEYYELNDAVTVARIEIFNGWDKVTITYQTDEEAGRISYYWENGRLIRKDEISYVV